jgi:hypothetical protein
MAGGPAPFLGQLDSGNFTEVRMDCKLRANNSLFWRGNVKVRRPWKDCKEQKLFRTGNLSPPCRILFENIWGQSISSNFLRPAA